MTAARRLLGLLAGPVLIGSCAPGQCTTVPAPPVPTAAPAPGTWDFLVTLPDGSYSRWDPCDGAITYEVRHTAATTEADRVAFDAELTRALASATAATGLTFEQVASDADAVVGLKDFPAPAYPAGTLGEGGGNLDRSTGEMSDGVLNVRPGLDAATLRYTLLHELGHMLGLGHVSSTLEVMYRYAVQPPKQEYASGDREGLRRVGATMPCFPAPTARRAAVPLDTVIVP